MWRHKGVLAEGVARGNCLCQEGGAKGQDREDVEQCHRKVSQHARGSCQDPQGLREQRGGEERIGRLRDTVQLLEKPHDFERKDSCSGDGTGIANPDRLGGPDSMGFPG